MTRAEMINKIIKTASTLELDACFIIAVKDDAYDIGLNGMTIDQLRHLLEHVLETLPKPVTLQ